MSSLEGRFEEAVVAYLFIVNILPVIIIPLLWYESKKVVEVINNWTDFEVNLLEAIFIQILMKMLIETVELLNLPIILYFQITYFKTTSKPLVLNLKSKALLISILLPLLSCVSVIITHVTMIHFKFERAFVFQIIPYCFLDTLTYMLGNSIVFDTVLGNLIFNTIILGAYWYLACETMSKTANMLAEDFQKVF